MLHHRLIAVDTPVATLEFNGISRHRYIIRGRSKCTTQCIDLLSEGSRSYGKTQNVWFGITQASSKVIINFRLGVIDTLRNFPPGRRPFRNVGALGNWARALGTATSKPSFSGFRTVDDYNPNKGYLFLQQRRPSCVERALLHAMSG